MSIDRILQLYETIKGHQRELISQEISNEFLRLATMCLDLLDTFERVEMTSDIQGKSYFRWLRRTETSVKKTRAINQNLIGTTEEARLSVETFFSALRENSYNNISAHDLTRGCYVAAIAFCACIDLFKENDQKTPGTFFEYLIGHAYATKLQINPRDRVDVLNLDEQTTLPTDFIFDLGHNLPKFHLPVKTSTRERVIQVWAHQRVLDGVYGTGRFWGTLVALAETKASAQNNNVTEICLPDQWKLYQMFIAQMKRIYYLDIPQRYAELNNVFPKIPVKEFGEFFHEVDDLATY